MQEECGHIPCIESFFIGVTADGIGRENDWDFLTRNSGEQVLDGGLSVGTVIDLACETIRVGQAGGRNLEGLVSRVQALGFKREFISSRPGSFDDEFSVAAKTENLEIDLSGMHLFIDVRVTGNSIREPAFLRTGDWLFERLSSNAGFREVYEGAWLSNDDNQDLLVEPGYFKLMLFVEEEGDRLEDFELVKILGCIP
jgi:hypothetical protein